MTDYTVGDTINFRFTTRSFSTGAPSVLTGGVLACMEDAVDAEMTAGVSLTATAVTGMYLATIAATGGNSFETGKDYDVYLKTGAVGAVSVIGEVVGHFTLGRSAAAVDLANGTDGLTALKAAIDAVPTAAEVWAAITTAAGNFIADHVIRRDYANVRASGDGDTIDHRSLMGSIATVVNKVSTTDNVGFLTIYHENDSTEFVQRGLTTDASADPITVIDPPA